MGYSVVRKNLVARDRCLIDARAIYRDGKLPVLSLQTNASIKPSRTNAVPTTSNMRDRHERTQHVVEQEDLIFANGICVE